MNTVAWYVIEFSDKGADDWFETSENADTFESAQQKMKEYADRRAAHNFEYRIVLKTLTSEIVSV